MGQAQTHLLGRLSLPEESKGLPTSVSPGHVPPFSVFRGCWVPTAGGAWAEPDAALSVRRGPGTVPAAQSHGEAGAALLPLSWWEAGRLKKATSLPRVTWL